MSNDPLEKKLGPRRAVECGGPRLQRFLADASEEVSTAKRAIHDNRNAAFLREGKNFRLGLAFENGIIDLDEVDLFCAEKFCYLRVGAGSVVRDSEVTG